MVVIQSEPKLYDKHKRTFPNGDDQVEPDKIFLLFVVFFPIQTHQILKMQVILSGLINPTSFVRSTLTTQQILGIVDKSTATGRENSYPLKFPDELLLATLKEERRGPLDTLKLHYMFSKPQPAGRQMMSKHRFMCNGQQA